MTRLYFDPVWGSDSNDGLSKDAPKQNPTSFSLSSGQYELLQAADTIWYSPTVPGGAALQINVSGAGSGQEFVIGVYQPLTGARISGEIARAVIDAGGSDLGIQIANSQSDHWIEGLEIRNVRRNSVNSAGIYHGAGSGSDVRVRYCLVRDCIDSAGLGAGAKFQCDRAVIEYCELRDNSTDNIYLSGDGHIVRGNKIIIPGFADGGADGIQCGGSVTNFVIEDNYINHRARNAKQCIIVQDSSVSLTSSNRISGNVLIGADPDLPLGSANEMKLIYVGAANTLVAGNFVYGGEYGIYCAAAGGSETSRGVRVVGNIVVQEHVKQIIGISLGSTGYSKAYNNVVIHKLGDLVNTDTGIQQYTAATDTDITNNIVMGYKKGIRSVLYGAANVRNNCIYGNGTALVDNGLASRTPDASNIQVDPLLDASYRPRAGSPCIGAGVYIPGAKHMGGLRLRSPADIGAYRYEPQLELDPSRSIDATRQITTSRSVLLNRPYR